MASSNDRRRSWFVSLAKRNDGDDMELKRSMIFRHVAELRPSRYAATLLITARRAGYIAVSFPPLLVMRVYIDCHRVSATPTQGPVQPSNQPGSRNRHMSP